MQNKVSCSKTKHCWPNKTSF